MASFPLAPQFSSSRLGGVMSRYHFATCGLAGQDFALLDPNGSVLEDDEAAAFHPRRLVRGGKKRTRTHPVGWTLGVPEGERDVCFVRVDPYDLRRKPG